MDFQNPAWTEVMRFAQERLDAARVQNDNVQMDAADTAALRGRIAAFKELLALPGKNRARVEAGELSGELLEPQ